MTRDEIVNMPAGRDMDALVAEKVMGEPHCVWIDNDTDDWEPPLHYSTDIAAAWQVVEKMMEDGDVFIEWWNDREWFVANKPMGVRNDAITAHCDGRATGTPSAPLAICRAVLLAVMESEE